MAQRVKLTCGHCGGTNVHHDAWADWDEEDQKWVLGNVFDHAHCDDCDGETNLEAVALENAQAANARLIAKARGEAFR